MVKAGNLSKIWIVLVILVSLFASKIGSTAIATHDPVDMVSYPFPGVKWTHRNTNIPRPLNINVLEVILTDPRINIFVSPGNPNPNPDNEICEEAIVRKTTTFVSEFGLQIGINGDFSDLKYCSHTPEEEGERGSVDGLGVSYRTPETMLPEIPRDQYSPHNNRPALTFTEFKEAYIGCYTEDSPFPPEVYNAVGGNKMLVENGQPVDPDTWRPKGGALKLNPRTSVGLSFDKSKLIIIVIDGRQQGFSEGVTLAEMSEYLIEFGAYTGLNLDGGGSSTMVFGTDNGPEIINYPSDGTERPRPNHIGIYANSEIPTPSIEEIYPRQKILFSGLGQNYPNPLNPETWIPFVLINDAYVEIRIFGMNGDLVRKFDLGYRPMGIYDSKRKAVYWDGTNESGEPVSSGTYFYNISADNFVDTKKMVIMR